MIHDLGRQLNKPGFIELMGCYDVLSAMILEHLGYQSVFVSGYGVAASLLGYPDIGLTTLFEEAMMVRNITRALNIPVVADIDDGYGGPDNVKRTIYEMERAGAAAVILEDQISPKRCGPLSDKKILPLNDYLKKLETALKCRQGRMCIIARTDEQDVDKAIERAQIFHEMGADATFIQNQPTLDAIKKIGSTVPGHQIINVIVGGKTPLLSSEQYHQFGFKIILYATAPLYVSAYALFKEMQNLKKSHHLSTISDQSMTLKEFQSFLEHHFLK